MLKVLHEEVKWSFLSALRGLYFSSIIAINLYEILLVGHMLEEKIDSCEYLLDTKLSNDVLYHFFSVPFPALWLWTFFIINLPHSSEENQLTHC